MLVNIITFIFGLIVGSFLNVCIYRLPKGLSIAFPGSFCPACKTKIKFYDNIPVLSYLLLGGKCRICKEKISPRYLLVEIITGILFLMVARFLNSDIFSASFYFYAAFVSFLVLASFVDIETGLIPEIPAYATLVAGLALGLVLENFFSALLGAISGFSFLFLISYFGKLYYKKEVLGEGDIILGAVFGSFLGPEKLFIALMAGYLAGAIFSLIAVAFRIKKMDDYIPFGPFLSFGALLALFFGGKIINFYVAIFLLN